MRDGVKPYTVIILPRGAKDAPIVLTLLETLQALGNGWRGQPYRPGQLLQGDARTLGQDLDDSPVDVIQA
jgi:predicted acyl esterase